MAELRFDIRLHRPGFTLELAETLPLSGITAVKGHSGSGKTTFLRVLSGLEPSAEARIELAGKRIDALPPEARRIGYVFQDARLFEHLDVAGNLAYGAVRRGVAQERIDEIVDALALAPLMARRPAGLSGGEARRVALGRALASGPKLLLLDEPLSGLDAARRAEILPYIARAADWLGLPVIYVSHAGREVDYLADRLLRIGEGQSLGWEAPPLALPATALEDGRFETCGMTLDLSGTRAKAGDRGEIRPLGPLTLSTKDPGMSSAALLLPARVNGAEIVIGTCMTLPNAQFSAQLAKAGLQDGAPLWISAADAAWRPRNQTQSPDNSN